MLKFRMFMVILIDIGYIRYNVGCRTEWRGAEYVDVHIIAVSVKPATISGRICHLLLEFGLAHHGEAIGIYEAGGIGGGGGQGGFRDCIGSSETGAGVQ